MLYLCMYVCMFVCYKKGSVTFDPNNATFTLNIDDCTGRIFLKSNRLYTNREKTLGYSSETNHRKFLKILSL